MKPFRRLFACFAAMLLIAWPAAAFAGWTRADTYNFIIYSNGDRAGLEQFAADVERFDGLLRLRLKVPRDPAPNRLTIYMVESQGTVNELLGADGLVAGFYVPTSDGSYAVVNRAKKTDLRGIDGKTILFHEYAHHFMFRNFTAPYPGWYVEGFAEFVSTASIAPDGGWTLGKTAFHRGQTLMEENQISIEKVLERPNRMTGQEVLQFYARSWLLVHMLSTQPQYAGKLEAYLKATTSGTPSLEAAKTVFGDLKTLDKALHAYLGKGISYVSSNKPIAVDGDVKITQLDATRSRLIDFGLQRRAGGQLKQARAGLLSFTSTNPQNADGWVELAQVEYGIIGEAVGKAEAEKRKAEAKKKPKVDDKDKDKKKDDEVDPEIEVIAMRDDDPPAAHANDTAIEAYVDRALAIDPNNPRANVLKGEIATWRLKAVNDVSAGKWQTARSWYRKAITTEPRNIRGLLGWYESFGRQGKAAPANASAGLESAFSLAPEATDVRRRLAFDYAHRGDFASALGLIKVIAYAPHTSQLGKALLRRIEAMKLDAEQKAADDKEAMKKTG